MSINKIEPSFLDCADGRLFVISFSPVHVRGPAVLAVPPFAEEMNKSRRLVTKLALALVQHGIPLVSMDLYGTGDSEGALSDATWTRWRSDVCNVMRWTEQRHGRVGLLIGIRLGCPLAVEALIESASTCNSAIMLQPVLNGRQHLDQFLRLGVAAAIARGEVGVTVSSLRRDLHDKGGIEIAGYELSAGLAEAIDRINVTNQMLSRLERVHWIEIGRARNARASAAGRTTSEAVMEAKSVVCRHWVEGQPFWASTEPAVSPVLVELMARLITESARINDC